MKNLFLATVLFATVAVGQAAQPIQPAPPTALAPILTTYYQVKDALFSGDTSVAAKAAGELLRTINGVDMKTLSSNDHHIFMALRDKLTYDSRHISESSDINHQREHFMGLSANMISLAKQTHLSGQPIYQDYCPMKKAYWLSGDSAVKNPFFGSTMPGCGKVYSTIRN